MTLRVLVADDNLLFAEALTQLLETDERVQVVGCAYNGAEAVDFARKLEPDLVLTDIRMPLMTGIEATERILAWRPETTVLLVTSQGSPREIELGLEAGAAACLTKDDMSLGLVDTVVECAVATRSEVGASFSVAGLP